MSTLDQRITQGAIRLRQARRAKALANLSRVPPNLRAARAARFAPNFLRAARAAGVLLSGAVLAPEAVLAAGLVAIGSGAYVTAKHFRQLKANRLRLDPPPAPVVPKRKPQVVAPLPIEAPTVVDTPPETTQPMAPRKVAGVGSSNLRIPAINRARKNARRTRANTPVTQVSLAPVSIGNTIRGVDTATRSTKNGIIVSGRDFMFSAVGSGSVTTWTMVGGAPLSPSAFPDSTLRQYVQMYNKFRFLGFKVHYITSSPTSANGDIMFYYGKNRESPFVNQTSANLLPFVISDPNTLLGPQWQNLSASFQPSAAWKSCDYGIEGTPKDYADGELFLLSKTSTVDSPGYVLFDYDIEFAEPSIQPRLLTMPFTRELYSQLGLGPVGNATVINTTYGMALSGTGINGLASVLPAGIQNGDVYKVIVDTTNSTLTPGAVGVTTSLIGVVTGTTMPFVMSDGVVFYAVYNLNLNAFHFYPSAIAAFANDRIFWAGATNAAINMVLQVWLSYVGSVNYAVSNAPNF